MPLQINLPISQRSVQELPVKRPHVIRLIHIERHIFGKTAVRQVPIPINMRSHSPQLSQRGLVIGGLRIAQLGGAERRLRHPSLHRQHRLRRTGGVDRIPACQLEHAGHVLFVFLARFHKARLLPDVVILFRKRQPSRGDIGQHSGWIVRILPAPQNKGRSHGSIVQFENDRLQRCDVPRAINPRQPGFQRLQPTRVDAGLIGASGVEIANQLLRAPLRSVLHLLQCLPECRAACPCWFHPTAIVCSSASSKPGSGCSPSRSRWQTHRSPYTDQPSG